MGIRIIRLHVIHPRPELVYEKKGYTETGRATIMAGSGIFCGVCGEKLCTVDKDLVFGYFDNKIFNESARQKNYMPTRFGLHHHKHVIGAGGKPYSFVSFEFWLPIQEQFKRMEDNMSFVDRLIANIKETEDHGEA